MNTVSERITVREASEILGMTPDYLRYLLRKGQIPIGTAVKGKGNMYRYLIFRNKLDEFVGK